MTATRRLTPGIVRPGSDPREDVDYERGLIERIVERLRPDEGWASLPLVLLLTGTMAWSISDARWILGRDNLTSFLVWVALLAALWSYVSARLRLSPWLAQAIGCMIGAFVIFEAVGASLPGSRPGLAGWFQATASSVTQAYLDLTWRHHATTAQTGHFALLLGVLVWGTAQAAAYDVFGYRRTVNGVLLLGVVLVANMSLTRSDQFAALVAFSFAALLLLLLSHSADEREGWMRHRIWRGRDFEAPHIDVRFAGRRWSAGPHFRGEFRAAPRLRLWPGQPGSDRLQRPQRKEWGCSRGRRLRHDGGHQLQIPGSDAQRLHRPRR